MDDVNPRGADQERPRRLAVLAAGQHGVVAHRQLKQLGYSRHEIDGLARRVHLHRLYRGVYAVGHKRLTTRGRWMAAVLACGPNAVLSHRAAIALYELRPVAGGEIDVTVPGRGRHDRDGIRVHNVRRLHRDDRATIDRIPVTAVHRTLLDYAESARFQQLRLALEAAERRELLDGNELKRIYARAHGHHGLKPLSEAVANLTGPAPWTQSELERTFHALIREWRLPEPRVNVLVEGFLVDFYWPHARLVVELDGYRYHKDRRTFEQDRIRDTKLQLAGIITLRVTQQRIQRQRDELHHDLIRALSAAPRAA